MSFIVKANYRDFAGSGWFAVAGEGKVSWGFSNDTQRWNTKEEAEAIKEKMNARAVSKGFKPTWEVMEAL